MEERCSKCDKFVPSCNLVLRTLACDKEVIKTSKVSGTAADLTVWVCITCTFHNSNSSSNCDLCDSARGYDKKRKCNEDVDENPRKMTSLTIHNLPSQTDWTAVDWTWARNLAVRENNRFFQICEADRA